MANAWDAATARTVELAQNSGWISGMLDQAAANTVGLGLRLRATPENDLFGMDEAVAQKWRKKVEARWSLWAGSPLECDIEGTRTIAQMQERYDLPDNFYPTSLSQTEAIENAPEPDPAALPGGD